MNSDNALEATDRVIRQIAALETEILNSDSIYVASEVFGALSNILPKDVSFDILFRERRRFPRMHEDLSSDWLYFPYLSFSVKEGRLFEFSDPSSVERTLASHLGDPSTRTIENTKTVLCFPIVAPPNVERLARRCATLVTAYYYASGPHDHFTANVARRHMTTYLAEHFSRDPRDLTRYLSKIFGAHVAYVLQTSKHGANEVIVDDGGVLPQLEQYREFRDDLSNAVKRKVNFTGVTRDNRWHYSIHSLVDEIAEIAPAHTESERPPTRLTRRGCAVLGIENGRLPLDVVKVVPLLFDAHRTAARAKDRDEFFREVQRSAQKLEDEFAATPPESIGTLSDAIWLGLTPAIGKLLATDMIDWFQVLVADPFNDRLKTVFLESSPSFPIDSLKTEYDLHADVGESAVAAFWENKFQHVGSTSPKGGGGEVLNGDRKRTESYFASPLHVGRVRVGTVVAGSKWQYAFETEVPYLESVVQGIGDFIHRMELVADIAWMSRISFMHAARHDLENFRRRLAGEESERLEQIVRSYSGMNTDARLQGPASIQKLVELSLQNAASTAEVPRIQVGADIGAVVVNEKDASILLSILGQLVSNSKSHSEAGKDPFSLSLKMQDRWGGPTVFIKYASAAGRVDEQVLTRLCVSPVPDQKSNTYHFGLFLSATQVRMLGGRASARQDVTIDLRRAPFEIAFEVPIAPVETDDGRT